MPPTDEEYLAEAHAALMMLVAQLDDGDAGRAELRGWAREVRALLTRADEAVGEVAAQELHETAAAARERVVKRLGTSAWDEPK